MNVKKPTQRCGRTVSTVDISADGTLYLWGGGSPGGDCSISICDANTHKVMQNLKGHKKPVLWARFLADGSVVSFSFDSHVCRWTRDGELAASNEVHLSHRADGFAVSNNGKIAVSGDYRGEISGWQLKDGTQAFTVQDEGAQRQIWAIAISPNSKQFVSGGAGGNIRVWDVAKRSEKSCVELGLGQHVQGLDWHPEGKRFAAAIAPDGSAAKGSKSRVAIFEGTKEVASLSTGGHQPQYCRFSSDGSLLAAAGGGTDRGGNDSKANCVIHVWEVESGNEIAAFTGHSGLVRDLAFSPDSKYLMSAGWDDTLRTWQIG